MNNSQGGIKVFELRNEQGNNRGDSVPADKASSATPATSNQQEKRPLTNTFVKESEMRTEWDDSEFVKPGELAFIQDKKCSEDGEIFDPSKYIEPARIATNNPISMSNQQENRPLTKAIVNKSDNIPAPAKSEKHPASTDNTQSLDLSKYKETSGISTNTPVSTTNPNPQERRPLTKAIVDLDLSPRNNNQLDSAYPQSNNLPPTSQQAVSTNETRMLEKPLVNRPDKVSNDTLDPANGQKELITSFVNKLKSDNSTPALADGQNKHLPYKILQGKMSHANEKWNPNPIDIAAEWAEYLKIIQFEGDVYFFNHDHKHYQKNTSNVLRSTAFQMFKKSAYKDKGVSFFNSIYTCLSLEAESAQTPNSKEFFDIKYCIGFKNGYLDLNNFMFYPPTSDKFITNYLEINCSPTYISLLRQKGLPNVHYDLKSLKCPCFDEFISQMANGNPDIVERIFQIIGYTLSNDITAKKLFIFGGAKDSGKSKLCEFIGSLFSKDAVTAMPLGDLANRFSRGELKGKSLCMDVDLPDTEISSKIASMIKGLTGGDLTSSDVKYQSRTLFTNRAKLVFSTNHSIRISSKESVLKSRFIYVPIEKSIHPDNQVSDILNWFEPEKVEIVLKSIGYYIELVYNKYRFSGDFPIDNSIYFERIIDAGELKKNTVEDFVNQLCFFTDFDCYTPTDILYNAYRNFCNGAETYVVDINNFSRLLNQMCAGKVKKDKQRVDGYNSSISIYWGIALNEETTAMRLEQM